MVLEGEAARHLAGPLRVRPGELIRVVDDSGEEHGVRVAAVDRAQVAGAIVWSRPAGGEPRLRVEVIQAMIREIDEAIAGLAEVGAAAILPVLADRSISRPSQERAAARARRWDQIAREAAELAHRAAIPTVHPTTDLGRAVTGLPKATRILVCVTDGEVALAGLDVDPTRPAAVVIGPEGGLDTVEVAMLQQAGAEMVHLGPRVLPSRRAGMLAVGLLLARAGDLAAALAPAP